MISKRFLLLSLSLMALIARAITPHFFQKDFTPQITQMGENIKIEFPSAGIYNIVPSDAPFYFNGHRVLSPQVKGMNKTKTANTHTANRYTAYTYTANMDKANESDVVNIANNANRAAKGNGAIKGKEVNQAYKVRSRADVQTVPVNVSLACDFDSFWPEPFFLDIICCSEEGYFDMFFFDDEIQQEDTSSSKYTLSAQVELPTTGGYVMVNASFEYWNRPGSLFLIEYVADPTLESEITLDPEKAKRNISWHMVDNQGNPLSLKKGHFDYELDEWVSSTEGNAVFASMNTDILIGDTFLCSLVSITDYTPDNTPYDTELYSLWTNYCGESIWMNSNLIMETPDQTYWAYGNAPISTITSFTNDPSTYQTYDFDIQHQPGYIQTTVSPYYLCRCSTFSTTRLGVGLKSDDNLTKAQMSLFPELCSGITSSFITGLGEYEYLTPWDDVNTVYTTTPYYITETDEFCQSPVYETFKTSFEEFFPNSPLLSYTPDDMSATFGEGPAVITGNLRFLPAWNEPELRIADATFNSVGVIGESRNADHYLMRYSASFDGTELFHDVDNFELESALEAWSMTKPASGLLSLKAVNTNQRLYQTPVTTTGEFLINYGTNYGSDQPWAPTLLIMNIRDNTNRLGFNLSTAKDSKVIIGAIASRLDPETYQYQFSLVEVGVEYSEHSGEDWTVLPTETSEEPAVGTLAVTSLSEIGEDAAGLYDLRITITAEDGNKFVETVRPALRITGESALETIINSKSDTPTIYSLQGQRVSATAQGLNIVVYPNGKVRKQVIR